MKTNLTEIIFILDRSGSMGRLVDDTIGGFNSFIDAQKKEAGEALITTVLFDDKYEILHSGVNIQTIAPLTSKEYFARGTTAMYDAIGKTINSVGNRLSFTLKENRPSKVIVVITTDGCENASHEFTKTMVKDMITRQTDKYNWEFIFLGANIDAATEASSLGIQGSMSANYTANSVGTASLYSSVSRGVSSLRNTGVVDTAWKDDVK